MHGLRKHLLSVKPHHFTHNSGFQDMRCKLQKLAVVFIGIWLAYTLNAGQTMAQDYSVGQLVIADPWAPPTLGRQRIGVVYFSVRNSGAGADRLLGVDLPQGGQARIHTSQVQDGVMRMRPIDAAAIPAGDELVLKPGGMHVMLNELPGPLIEGGQLKLILRFEKAGPVDVEAVIEKHPSASHQDH